MRNKRARGLSGSPRQISMPLCILKFSSSCTYECVGSELPFLSSPSSIVYHLSSLIRVETGFNLDGFLGVTLFLWELILV